MKIVPLIAISALILCAQSKDISGTWIAKRQGPGGEMEIVYELKVLNGKVTGTQKMPFGDSPIVDGKIDGEELELIVEAESFGTLQKRTVKGKIIGDALEITPAMPGPPPGGGGPGGPGAGAGPGPGGPGGGGRRAMMAGPMTFHRGVPTPSFRAPSVNYATLAKVDLPALRDVPYNGLAKTPPMGWNSWNKFRTKIDDKTVREVADAMATNGMRDA